jgi:hypothetical protein
MGKIKSGSVSPTLPGGFEKENDDSETLNYYEFQNFFKKNLPNMIYDIVLLLLGKPVIQKGDDILELDEE